MPRLIQYIGVSILGLLVTVGPLTLPVARAAEPLSSSSSSVRVQSAVKDQSSVQAQSTVDLKVGAGQAYASLQAAIDAVPANPSQDYRILVYPGTYFAESVLTGKNTASQGRSITITNAEQTKPIITGASTLGSGKWSPVGGYNNVYAATVSAVLAVTDQNERLKKISSLAELGRINGGYYFDGSKLYVRLSDLANPNARALQVIRRATGLQINNVANVTVRGVIFNHYGTAGLSLSNSVNNTIDSVKVQDAGERDSGGAGIKVNNSSGLFVVNSVVSSIGGAGILATGSTGLKAYNNSLHKATIGIDLVGSSNADLQNNVLASAFEIPLRVDAGSKSGLSSAKNSYWNPSGVIGEVAGTKYSTISSLGAVAGGENGSLKGDPLFRRPTAASPDDYNYMLRKVHDIDAAHNGGNGWASDTNAAHLRWDQGYYGEALMNMYRATGDTSWLAKLVKQSNTVWGQAYENLTSPQSTADGYLGWSTSRYAVALIDPATISSGGGKIIVVDSAGKPLGVNVPLRVYGPGNGDNIPDKTFELHFGTNPDVRYEVWDTTGTATCVSNCGFGTDNYTDGQKDVTLQDSYINGQANYAVKFRFTTASAAGGDVYQIDLRAKTLLEYGNIDAGLTAPMIDFAAEVLGDPTIQNIPVEGQDFLYYANDYISKVDTNIYPKWEPFWKDLATAPGSYGAPGGVYVYPSDEHYSLPDNTYPLNMQADMGRLWSYMYKATGQTKYKDRVAAIADFMDSKIRQPRADDGKYYLDWYYWEPAGNWDTWTSGISEDVSHAGVVALFIKAAFEVGVHFNSTDIQRLVATFTSRLWEPENKIVSMYFNKDIPLTYDYATYYIHSWQNLPGGEAIADLVNEVYRLNEGKYNTDTGVIYETMAGAALAYARQAGAENYRVRSGSSAYRNGNTTSFAKDFDERVRADYGNFDRGAFTFVTLDRLYGSNRYQTAVEISKYQYPTGTPAGGVVLARGDVHADGLAGAGLAAQVKGPILLTKPNSLPAEVLSEIKRVLPSGGKVWLLGGEVAINNTVNDALRKAGFTTQRLSGANRYATAAAIGAQLSAKSPVYLASGTSFPDPLAASAVAVAQGGAILLTKANELPVETASFLAAHKPAKIYVIGGSAVVDNGVEKAAGKYAPTTRVWGSNRYATAVAIAKTFFADAVTFTFATGLDFPDSLAAGPTSGSSKVQGPLLLVKKDRVPGEVSDYLNAQNNPSDGGVLYGGPAAVDSSTKAALESLL